MSNNNRRSQHHHHHNHHHHYGDVTRADNLLNFRYAPPPSQHQQGSGHYKRGNRRKNEKRSAKEQSRRNKLQSDFYLHTSPEHSFILKRRCGTRSGHFDDNHTFSGPGSLKWDNVEVVK